MINVGNIINPNLNMVLVVFAGENVIHAVRVVAVVQGR
jgi:hypothetical protein